LHKAEKRAGTGNTALTNVFSGRPTRCAVNRVMQELGPMAGDAPASPLGFSAMAPLRAAAEANGNRDFSAHHCGQAPPLGREMPAGQLVRHLAEGTRVLIEGMTAKAR
jgi:nitronate monooxygenase